MTKLRIYDKQGNIVTTGGEFTGDTGYAIISDLAPHTKYNEEDFLATLLTDEGESEKIPLPFFMTHESSYKEISMYVKDHILINGKSAYDIAVDNGFEGTEKEWLKTLKGEKGEDGGGVENKALYDKLNNTFTTFKVPSTLNFDLPFDIETNDEGEVRIDYDVSDEKNEVTKTYYVDINTGNNANKGTISEPFKSINRALRYGDADEIIVNEGVYGWSDSFNGYTQSKPYNVIGKGKVIVGAHRDNLTWSKNEEFPNVYQTNTTSVIEVIDCKYLSNVRVLDKKSSVKDVSENNNSFFIDGNTLYVRTYDDRKPDNKILPNMTMNATKFIDMPKVYLENLIFSNTLLLQGVTSDTNEFYAKDCHFMVGSMGNALSVEGYAYNVLQNCKASLATRDGFNYHARNGISPKVIEINCVGFNNGRDGADQNNGSTSHDGSHIIRINGEYYNNGGANVIDVNEDTVSVNIGVHSHHSRATKNTVSNSNFKNGNVGASKMYLTNCVSNGSDYSVVTATSQGSKTYIDNSLLEEEQTEV